MTLEKQLEFDFMRENWLTDTKSYIKPYTQKGQKVLKYAGYVALVAVAIPIAIIGTAVDFVDGLTDMSD